MVTQNHKWKENNKMKQYMKIHHVKYSSGTTVVFDNNDTYKITRVLVDEPGRVKTKCYNIKKTPEQYVYISTLPFIPGDKESHFINIGTQVCVTYDEEYRKQYPKEQFVYIGIVKNMILDQNGIYIYNIQFGDRMITYSNESYTSSLEKHLFVEENNWTVHIVPIQYNEYTNEIYLSAKAITYTFFEYYQHLFFPLCVLFTTVILPKLLDR